MPVHFEDPTVWQVYQVEVSIGSVCWALEENVRPGEGRSTTPLRRLPDASDRVGNADIDFRLDDWGDRIEVHIFDNAMIDCYFEMPPFRKRIAKVIYRSESVSPTESSDIFRKAWTRNKQCGVESGVVREWSI